MKRIAVVTGGNRGIGFAVCKLLSHQGLMVVMTSRSLEAGLLAKQSLMSEGVEVDVCQLDVTSAQSIDSFCRFMREKYSRIDVLINNAGVMLDTVGEGPSLRIATSFESSIDSIRATLETNTIGPLELIRRVVPFMIENRYGRIVNVSSGLGQLSTAGALWIGYRISKISLNALTKIFAEELKGINVLVNSASPGWVRTRMGGEAATSTPEQGADTIVWLATLPDGGPSGGFFGDRQPVAW